MHRKLLAAAILYGLSASAQIPGGVPVAEPATVRIAVLTLFHPHRLTVAFARPTPVMLDGIGTTLQTVEVTTGHVLHVPAGNVTLSVPGRLTRTYTGALRILPQGEELLAIVTMQTETAVASIVAAEAPPGAPSAALEAQSIVSRSYLLASPPGEFYDATDTTHDQFLREAPATGSPAALATAATRGTVILWQPRDSSVPQLVRAVFSRSCGGVTRVPARTAPGAYPYYPVRCELCLRHPERWTRPASATTPATEAGRIVWNRTHGWDSLPSVHFIRHGAILEGRGWGHGTGLCQLGAAEMAMRGESAAAILAHYFPNTKLHHLR